MPYGKQKPYASGDLPALRSAPASAFRRPEQTLCYAKRCIAAFRLSFAATGQCIRPQQKTPERYSPEFLMSVFPGNQLATRKSTGNVYFTRTTWLRCLPGLHFGDLFSTRIASSESERSGV